MDPEDNGLSAWRLLDTAVLLTEVMSLQAYIFVLVKGFQKP